jgi:hypothetical protein
MGIFVGVAFFKLWIGLGTMIVSNTIFLTDAMMIPHTLGMIALWCLYIFPTIALSSVLGTCISISVYFLTRWN